MWSAVGARPTSGLVSLGPVDGDLVMVTKGVSANDQVINGNLQKIGPGARCSRCRRSKLQAVYAPHGQL